MDTNLNKISEGQINGEEGEKPNFLDYIEILLKWWRFIVINLAIVAGLAVVISLLLPKWYKATASILPPKDQGLLNLVASTSSALKGLSSLSKLGGLSQSTGAYNYFAILKSRSVMEAVARKFDLVAVYDVGDSSMERTIKELKANTSFESQEDDYITIEVYDQDPRRAADIANFFVELLNSKSIELGTLEARGEREFIEERVDGTRKSLHDAEESLKRFQEQSGVMITPEQTSSISALAELYALKAKKEVEVAILERTVTKDSDVLQQLRIELNELSKKLATIPEAGLQTLRLYREVLTNEKILEYLTPIYEQAKINEKKDVPVLMVLDTAVPAERKVKPQRLLIVLSTSVLFLFFSIVLVFGMHGILRKEMQEKPLQRKLQSRIARVASAYHIDVRS